MPFKTGWYKLRCILKSNCMSVVGCCSGYVKGMKNIIFQYTPHLSHLHPAGTKQRKKPQAINYSSTDILHVDLCLLLYQSWHSKRVTMVRMIHMLLSPFKFFIPIASSFTWWQVVTSPVTCGVEQPLTPHMCPHEKDRAKNCVNLS